MDDYVREVNLECRPFCSSAVLSANDEISYRKYKIIILLADTQFRVLYVLTEVNFIYLLNIMQIQL